MEDMIVAGIVEDFHYYDLKSRVEPASFHSIIRAGIFLLKQQITRHRGKEYYFRHLDKTDTDYP